MRRVLIAPEVFRDKPGVHLDLLRSGRFEVIYPSNRGFARGLCTREEMAQELSEVCAVLAGGETYDQPLLDRLDHLRVIARVGVGYDRVNVVAATSNSIAVTITPTANHDGVAEHALALLFAVAKGIVRHDGGLRAGHWSQLPTEPIRGRVLGLLGLGRIGRSLAVRAIALGMSVIACERHPSSDFLHRVPVSIVDFESLLAKSDFLSLHCPLNDETRNLFNKDVFHRMKPGSVLINTARGGLVNEADLVHALETGHISGAGLDVYQVEPMPKDHPFYKLDQVVLSPHLAGSDRLSLARMAEEAARSVLELSAGRWPGAAVVNQELQSHWHW